MKKHHKAPAARKGAGAPPKPGTVNPGGPVIGLVPAPVRQHPAARPKRPPRARKPAAKKKPPVRHKLAAPGESCVLDACYALAGCRPDLDGEDGLFIPDALEALYALGLITGLAPADLDSDLDRPGLILGADLPGPHAVLTVPGGWWSWGELYDPADFPDAVIGEAWEVTWPS